MDNFYRIILLSILSCILLRPQRCLADDTCPIVDLISGKVQGVEKESRDDRDFYAYRGIPYAKPPVGELRFEAPVPPDNWTDVKEVNEYAKPCIQYDPFEKKVVGSEDCLKLNVFTPKIGDGMSKKLLPVMVFIHGGYFMAGSSNDYRPHYFMDEDIVVVTFNYRLGSFGFLNTEDGVVHGNMGLKDQVLALKWVQQNVRKFGGDPKRVTLFGSSAGAASVHYHMLSPMSKGLFRKAITQSGTAFKLFSLQTRPREAALRLGRNLSPICRDILNVSSSADQCEPDSTSSLVRCLKKIDAKKLAEYHKEFYSTPSNPLAYFTPSIEDAYNYGNETAFLTEHPFTILSTGRQTKMPWMTGVNSEEGLQVTARILNSKELTDRVENHWDDLAPKFLLYDRSRKDITKSIRRYYLSDSEPLENISSNSTNLNNSSTNNAARNLTPRSNSNTTTIPILSPVKPPGVAYDYAEDEDSSFSFEEKFISLTNLFSDRYYISPMSKAVQIQKKYSPVWLYYYNYQGQYSMSDVFAGKAKADKPGLALRQLTRVKSWFKSKVLGKTEPAPKHLGVCHLDETILLFKYPELKIKENTKDYEMSKDLVKLWVHFAYNENDLKFRNISWLPTSQDSEKLTVMRFGTSNNSTGMIEAPYAERARFWDALTYLAPYQQF